MIVNQLPEIMTSKGVSIRRLSQMTGVTYTTIRAVYHGERRSVQIAVLEAICQVLDIQPGDIYLYVEEQMVESGEASAGGTIKPSSLKPAQQETVQLQDRQIDGWKHW